MALAVPAKLIPAVPAPGGWVKLPRRIAAIGSNVILAAALIAIIVAAAEHALSSEWAAASATGTTLLVALSVAAQRQAARRPPEDKARDLASELAPKVLGDWTAEMPARGLESGRWMDLRWQLGAASNPNAQRAANVADRGTLGQLTGCVGHATDGGWLPRLVITGVMGGGKTAACILFTVDLAKRHGQLPVLMQLAAWDPGTPLRHWMASQLLEIFPEIGKSAYGRRVATVLADRHIVPILDGLDQIREPSAALAAIDEQLGGRPFVLTCRTSEFVHANAGGVLHQALIVDLQPMRSEEAREILLAYEPADVDGPLAPLIAALGSQPAGPVAEALSTPFMVSLARDAGSSLPDLVPAEPEPDAADVIRQRLLGTLVRKAYTADHRTTRQEARRYLRFLAQHTDSAGRLAWWLLYRAVPLAVFVVFGLIVAGAICAGLGALFFTLFGHPRLGLWIGLIAGLAGAAVDALIPQDPPRRAVPRFRSLRVPTPNELGRTIGFGIIGAGAMAVIVFVLYGPARYIVAGGLLSGVTYALASYVGQPNDPLKVVTPASLLRADRISVMYAWLVGALPGALTGAYLGFSFPAGHRAEFGSLTILRYTRPELALLGAACGCLLSGAGLGLMAMGSSAWGKLMMSQLWLALRGRTPLRLMSFLEDAYKLGVLRQANGYYEFRHQMLQRYLADPDPERPAGARGPSASSAALS
jgi:hypothetical protein